MADFSLKQFLLGGAQFLGEGRPRSNSANNAPTADELTRKQEQQGGGGDGSGHGGGVGGGGGGGGGGARSLKAEPSRPRRMSSVGLGGGGNGGGACSSKTEPSRPKRISNAGMGGGSDGGDGGGDAGGGDGGGDSGGACSSKTEPSRPRRISNAGMGGGGDSGDACSSKAEPSRPRRMSSAGLTTSRRSSIASLSNNNSAKREIEKIVELSHEGETNSRGKLLLSFHYNRDTQTLTLKVIQAKELRCGHGGEVCAFVTISFLPTSKVRLETKVRMLTSNPVWKEVFLIRNFLEEDFKEHKAFAFEVWDKTSNGTSQLIGETVVLLRSFSMDELLLEKGVVLWKHLCMDRQESELSLGQLVFYVRQCRRKNRLTVMIEKVTNAAIPASAKQPSLYMKVQLLRDETKVLSERTKTVTNSYNPEFKHKMHVSLQSGSMQNASLKLVLKQQANARLESLSSVQQHSHKTIGVVHLSMYSERDDLRSAWKQILAAQDEKMHFRLKFSAPFQLCPEG